MVSKRSLYLGFVFLGFVAALLVNAFFLHNRIQSWTYRVIANPLQFFERSFQSRNKELANLRRERDELLSGVSNETTLERENTALRRQLNVGVRQTHLRTTAYLFGLQRNVMRSSAFIDQGMADGIVQGMTVISAGNILVGRVVEVFDHTSRLQLADDPQSVISVRPGTGQLLAEARGALKNEIILNLVSRTDMVETGMLLTTSGLDSFSEGLIVGKISSVKPAPKSLFQDVRGELLFDPSLTTLVFILR